MPSTRRFATRHTAGALVLSLALVALSGQDADAKAPAWSKPFKATPAQLKAAADALKAPADTDVYVLHERIDVTFDAKGLPKKRYHKVSVAVTERGVAFLKSLKAKWSTWFENKPSLQVRVIDPRGREHKLDQSTIMVQSPRPNSPDVYSDSKRLETPIPAVDVGSVVETVMDVSAHRRPYASGGLEWLDLGSRHPVRQLDIRVSAPKSVPLTWRVYGSKAKVKDSTKKGVRRLAVKLSNVAPDGYHEAFRPLSAKSYPQLLVSTGTTWQAAAKEYAALVEQQLKGHTVAEKAKALTAGAKTVREKASRILDFMRSELRYTAIFLGDSAIVPRKPATTLARRFGDCKDLSTLMVAMLRSVGVKANVALLRAGNDEDVVEDLPTMGLFNHAIVRVVGPKGDIWVDPTVLYSEPGQLPSSDQRRMALIAAPETTKLTRLPHTTSKDTTLTTTVTLRFRDDGYNKVEGSTTGTGVFAHSLKQRHGAQPVSARKSTIASLKRRYGAKKDPVVKIGNPRADGPFSYSWSIERANWAFLDTTSAKLTVDGYSLLNLMPRGLKQKFGEPKKTDKWWTVSHRKSWLERKHDLVLGRPYQEVQTTRIELPPGFRLKDMPKDQVVKFGPAVLTRKVTSESKSTVTIRWHFDSASRFTPAQVREFNKAFRKFDKEPALELELELGPLVDLKKGKVKKALRDIDAVVRAHPDKPKYKFHRTSMLLTAGLGRAAWRSGREATKLHPKSPWAWVALGEALTHDEAGRYMQGKYDRDGAVAAYKKLLEIREDWFGGHHAMATLLQHDSKGARWAKGADLAGSLKYLQRLEKDKDLSRLVEQMEVLFRLKRFDDLNALADKYEQDNDKTRRMAALTWRLMGVAVSKGAEQALKQGKRLKNSDAYVAAAGGLLFKQGHFVPGAKLLVDVAKRQPKARAYADMLRGVITPPKPWTGPCKLVEQATRLELAGKRDKAKKLYAKRYRKHVTLSAAGTDELRGAGLSLSEMGMRMMRCTAKEEGAPGEALLELTSVVPGQTDPMDAYTVSVGGKPKILPTSSDAWPLAHEALLALADGKKAAARRWLARAWKHLNSPLATLTRAQNQLLSVWLNGTGALKDGELLAVAAVINARGPLGDASLKGLEAALSNEKDARP